MSYRESKAIPYNIYIVCDWCRKESFLYSALAEGKYLQHNHYHPVNKVISNRKQLLVSKCHICSICIDEHAPFFWVKDGLVHYGEFKNQ